MLKLFLGNKAYSSWSMRGWLAVKLARLDVDIKVIQFERPGPTRAIAELSPNGLVPFLEHNGARVWESLAICAYCAESQPALWPADRVARAQAKSMAAEMHAGFRDLRIARIEALWAETRARFSDGGPFLFGSAFTAADAMFAPVVARFLGWKPEISAQTAAYCAAIRAHPLVAEWYDGAAAEPESWLIEDYEKTPAKI